MKNVEDASTIKDRKVRLNKKSKAAIIVVSIIAVIGIIVAVCFANKTALVSEISYLAMPKVIDISEYDSSLDLVLYVEKNKDFDAKKDEKEPLKAFKYYYYDENGKKVSLNYDDLVFEGTDNEMMVCAQFYLEAVQKLNGFVKVLKILAVILVVLLIVGGTVLWFFIWSKKYDEEKEAIFNKKNNSSVKGKKKKKK